MTPPKTYKPKLCCKHTRCVSISMNTEFSASWLFPILAWNYSICACVREWEREGRERRANGRIWSTIQSRMGTLLCRLSSTCAGYWVLSLSLGPQPTVNENRKTIHTHSEHNNRKYSVEDETKNQQSISSCRRQRPTLSDRMALAVYVAEILQREKHKALCELLSAWPSICGEISVETDALDGPAARLTTTCPRQESGNLVCRRGWNQTEFNTASHIVKNELPLTESMGHRELLKEKTEIQWIRLETWCPHGSLESLLIQWKKREE